MSYNINRRMVLGLALFGSLCFAQSKPDFSGEWKLNVEKSDFGAVPQKPEGLSRKIEHKDPELKVATTQTAGGNTQTRESKYTTDGKDSMNKYGETEVKSVAKWEGAALNIMTSREVQGNTITQTENWTLSGDGKELIVNNDIKTPMGELKIKLVMDKK